jgi:hypothetical protein
MMDKILEILTTITEESQNAALTKCRELNLDPNRGVVSLDESFINLNSARSLLMDAVEKRKLIQLPITVQKNFLSYLQAIQKHQLGLISGTDEVVNLAAAIEQLNTAIWQYGFHNLSDEVLGYQKKLNQLKELDLESKKLKRELNAGLKVKEGIDQVLLEANKNKEALQKQIIAAQESANKTASELVRTTEISQKASALLATIQQNEITSTQQLAAIKTSNAEISVLEKKIKEFYGEVDKYREILSTSADESKNTIQSNNTATEQLISRLKELENQIRKQIEKATGYSLFHSFQTRQEALKISKRYWVWALIFMVAVSISLSAYVMKSTTGIDVAFFMKLSMSLPLIYAIAFCTIQYSRERKLEEEYAFKSNISISLVPYQELVEKLVSKEHQDERQKYATFIIDSITNVFTSPTDKVFDHGEKQQGFDAKTIKHFNSILEPIIKLVKP